MVDYICALIISFFVYGFAGWIWESFLCPLITGHRIKNSGFLNGPIVPIYGVGALTVSLLFSSQETYLSIFIEGAFVACVIEYLTSWAMEALYHRRWWDYSDKAFHVNGRVCLEGFLVFGLFSVICVKHVQPALLTKILQYHSLTLVIVATALTTILILDLCFTVITLTHFNERVEEFIKEMEKVIEEFEESKEAFEDTMEFVKQVNHEKYMELMKHRKYSERRILKAFPQLTHKKKKDE